jgi:hypothetical protein
MENNKMEVETTNVEQMKNMVFEVMDKYTFLADYLKQPDINTGRPMPTFVKIMSTILYLRGQLCFKVEADCEPFYDDIDRNDYSDFENLELYEIFKILVCFVTMACSFVNTLVPDDDSRDKMISSLRAYYYKNKDFVTTI